MIAYRTRLIDGFRIEHDWAPPSKPLRYPFGQMEVGESVFIPGKRGVDMGGPIWKHRPKKFSVRTEKMGVRVWRIA